MAAGCDPRAAERTPGTARGGGAAGCVDAAGLPPGRRRAEHRGWAGHEAHRTEGRRSSGDPLHLRHLRPAEGSDPDAWEPPCRRPELLRRARARAGRCRARRGAVLARARSGNRRPLDSALRLGDRRRPPLRGGTDADADDGDPDDDPARGPHHVHRAVPGRALGGAAAAGSDRPRRRSRRARRSRARLRAGLRWRGLRRLRPHRALRGRHHLRARPDAQARLGRDAARRHRAADRVASRASRSRPARSARCTSAAPR